MPLLPLLLALSFVQAPVTLDTFQLAGKSVQAVLPVGHPPTYASKVDFEGWTYSADAAGSLLDRHLGAGGWDELKQLWEARGAFGAEWRAKFVIFTYSDILDHGKDGVLREQRSDFFGADRAAALGEIALFGSMVEAYSGGNLKFVPEVQFEDQAMRFDSPREVPFGEEFARGYFTPRVNAGGYEPDDKVYRGPYNSIFFLHDGLADTTCNTSVFGMPISGLPFYSAYDAANRGQLARRLFNAWYGHVVFWMSRHGYRVGSVKRPLDDPWTASPIRLRLPQGLLSDSIWPVVANLKDTNDYAAHWPVEGAGAQPWPKVQESPWTLLPSLEGNKTLPGDVGRDVPAIQLSGIPVTAIEPEFAVFEAQRGQPSECTGFVDSASGPKLVLNSVLGPGEHSGLIAQPQNTDFETGDPRAAISGYFSYKLVDDSERRAKVALVEENWVSRTGWVQLINGGGSHIAGPSKYVDILLKEGFGSHTIEVVGEQKTVRYDLFGSPPAPAESQATPPIRLALKEDGSWQHVVVDVSNVGPLVGVYLTAGNAKYWKVDLTTKPAIYIDYARFSSSAQPTPVSNVAAVADLTSPDPEARLLYAAGTTAENYIQRKVAIVALLSDPSVEVALNAANVFTRVKDKSVVEQLAELSKKLDPRLAEVALQALKFQDTDIARGHLLTALAQGTFEANRFFAALTLSDEKDPNLAEPYSLLIDSKNRETRLAAVHALSKMPGDKPRKFLLGMMLDTDPEVEAAVAQLEDPTFPDFEKRMEWYAINDASDWVRAQSFIAMMRSPLPGLAGEGFKGTSDDSYEVRLLVLQYLEQHPGEGARPNVLAALEDPREEVRAQALRTLAVLPTPANLNELTRVGMDIDPRVQLSLIDLAKKQNLKLSQPILDQLKKSADGEVINRSKDLIP